MATRNDQKCIPGIQLTQVRVRSFRQLDHIISLGDGSTNSITLTLSVTVPATAGGGKMRRQGV